MLFLNIKRNDTRTGIKATLKNSIGLPVDLTDANVKFIMKKYSRTLVNRSAEFADIAGGQVYFIFAAGELAETGFASAEFEVTYSDGSVEPFPNAGHITINIE